LARALAVGKHGEAHMFDIGIHAAPRGPLSKKPRLPTRLPRWPARRERDVDDGDIARAEEDGETHEEERRRRVVLGFHE